MNDVKSKPKGRKDSTNILDMDEDQDQDDDEFGSFEEASNPAPLWAQPNPSTAPTDTWTQPKVQPNNSLPISAPTANSSWTQPNNASTWTQAINPPINTWMQPNNSNIPTWNQTNFQNSVPYGILRLIV